MGTKRLDERNRGMLDDDYWTRYTADFGDYELGPAVGFGASSTVYSAVFQIPSTSEPPNIPKEIIHPARKPALSIDIPSNRGTAPDNEERECAIKVSGSYPDVNQLFKETRLLALCKHPHVLRVLAAFTLPPDHNRVAIVTPLIAGGSLAGILEWRSRLASTPKSHHHLPFLPTRRSDEGEKEGIGTLNEDEIRAVTKQVLEGLAYLHDRGFLHRDLKAGNLLVQPDGTILLADFGVGGDMNDPLTPIEKGPLAVDSIRFDRKSEQSSLFQQTSIRAPLDRNTEAYGKRKSFVGTPNWMAPEVILGQRYDSKADIWSLGITLLELAHGSAPRSRETPNYILKHTVLDAPPTLDRSVGHYSKAMKEFVDSCLVKEAGQRPSASALLQHPWLKGAKKKAFLADALLAGLPSLEARQEIRRVPTVSSLASRASSWDFSVPSSPNRASLLPPVRSPSTFSQLDYFPTHPSRSHSRSSSRIPSLPPSPRVSLRQWAELTASEISDGDPMSMRRRTASERGKRRSGMLRKGQSVSFDESQQVEGSLLIPVSRARRLPSVDGGLSMTPVAEASLGSSNQDTSLLLSGVLQNGLDQLNIMRIGPMSASPEEEKTKSESDSMTLTVTHTAEDRSVAGNGSAASHTAKQTQEGPPQRSADLHYKSPHVSSPPLGDKMEGLVRSDGTEANDRGRKGWIGRKISVKKGAKEPDRGAAESNWKSGLSSKLKAMRNH